MSKSFTNTKLFAFSLTLCIYFSQYYFFTKGITISDFLLIVSALFIWNSSGISKKKFSLIIIFFYLIGLYFSSLSLFFINDKQSFNCVPFEIMLSRWFRYGIYALLIYIFVGDNNIPLARSRYISLYYRLACYFFSSYAVLQLVVFETSHYLLPINLMPFPFATRELDLMNLSNSFTGSSSYRVYSAFVEPSFLIKFLAPGLVFSVFGWPDLNRKQIHFPSFAIISLIFLISTSVQGYFIFVFFSIVLFLRSKGNIKFSILFVSALFSLIFLRSEYFAFSKDRFFSVFSENAYGFSINLRLFRGYSIWWQLPFKYKVLGIGYANIANFVDYHNIYTTFDHPYRETAYLEYVNGISGLLIETGLFGIILYFVFLFYLIKNAPYSGKLILYMFIFILFSSSDYLSLFAIFYFSMAYQCVSNNLKTTNIISSENILSCNAI